MQNYTVLVLIGRAFQKSSQHNTQRCPKDGIGWRCNERYQGTQYANQHHLWHQLALMQGPKYATPFNDEKLYSLVLT